jgi:hypothetical protein
MKNNYKLNLMKPTLLKMSIFGIILFTTIFSCTKEEQKKDVAKSNTEDWVEVTNKTVFEDKEYIVKFKADKNSSKMEFIQNLPMDVLLKLKPYEEARTMVKEIYIDETGEEVTNVYKNQADFESNSKLYKESLKVYSKDSKEPFRLKGLNGGKTKLWEHGANSGFMLQSLTNQWLPYGNNYMYQDNYANVGPNCNDKISTLELFHEQRWDGYTFTIYEHSDYLGLNVYFWFTPWQSQIYYKKDLWTVNMTYYIAWYTTWNDQLTSWKSRSGNL